MAVSASMDISALLKKIRKVPEGMRKPLTNLVEGQGRLWLNDVIKYTPPANADASGNAAKKQGEAAVARDINQVYGGAPQAYLEIKKKDPAMARAFYKAMLQSDFATAQDILRRSGSKWRNVPVQAFDESLHQKFRRAGGKVNRQVPAQITTNWRKIKPYISKRQKKVGYLGSGYAASASGLKSRIPAWMKRHGSGGGSFRRISSKRNYRVKVTNSVKYANYKGAQDRQDRFARGAKANIRKKLKAALRKTLKDAGL